MILVLLTSSSIFRTSPTSMRPLSLELSAPPFVAPPKLSGEAPQKHI
jgi:hypothetical protein